MPRSTHVVALVGGVIAALQAGYIAGSGDRDPSPFLLVVVGVIASAEMRLHGLSFRRTLVAVFLGAAAAGIWWEIFAAEGVDRWVTVADALLCPLVGMGAAWLLRTDKGRNPAIDS